MKKAIAITAAAAAMSFAFVAPVDAGDEGSERVDVVREWEADGSAASGSPEVIGSSNLIRRESGLKTTVHVEGLEPGGVYTFWLIAVQGPVFPDDVFVALGGSAIANAQGMATARLRASTEQSGIDGFLFPDGTEAGFDELTDPMGAVVRVEVAYHGQAADAGDDDDLDVWKSNFWTGDACPLGGTPNPNPGQPHCPVYFAATHTP